MQFNTNEVIPTPQPCEICKSQATHESPWGWFCEVCWVLFGFDKQEPT